MNKKEKYLLVLFNIYEDLKYLSVQMENVNQRKLSLPSLSFGDRSSQRNSDPFFKECILLEEKIKKLIETKYIEKERVSEELRNLFESSTLLSERMKKILVMRYVNRFSFTKVANVLCISLPSVSKLHKKALEYISISDLERIYKSIVEVNVV